MTTLSKNDARALNLTMLGSTVVDKLDLQINDAFTYVVDLVRLQKERGALSFEPHFFKLDRFAFLVDYDFHVYLFDIANGVVYSVKIPKTGKCKVNRLDSGINSTRKAKYANFTVKLVYGVGLTKRLVVYTHQALALLKDPDQFNKVFKACGCETAVNHRDNVDYNNSSDNLEWVSVRDNNLHASYVKKLAGLNPDQFFDLERRYLKQGVSAYTLRFALTLYKTVKCDETLFTDIMSTLGEVVKASDLARMVDVQKYTDDPVDEILTVTALRFLNNPQYVKQSDITEDFISAFDMFKHVLVEY